ncbi:hypothetical protein BE11_03265 [Sorangium cellulosum]|nr:hypothetical protein BE11_03265 [Sorangium cellulosum]
MLDRLAGEFRVLDADSVLDRLPTADAGLAELLDDASAIVADMEALGPDRIEAVLPLLRAATEAGIPLVLENAHDPSRMAAAIGYGVPADAAIVEPSMDGTRFRIEILGNAGDMQVASGPGEHAVVAVQPPDEAHARRGRLDLGAPASEEAPASSQAPTGASPPASRPEQMANDVARRLREIVAEKATSVKPMALTMSSYPQGTYRSYLVNLRTTWSPGWCPACSWVQTATMDIGFEVELVASANPPGKFLIISGVGSGTNPGGLPANDGGQRGWFQESVNVQIQPDASAPLISHMHTPNSPNGVNSYAVSNGCSFGGGVGTDGPTTSFSCGTTATSSVTLSDFSAIDSSVGTRTDWTWRMSAAEGNPYNAPRDLVNPWTGYLRDLPFLAKSTLTPQFQAIYRADSRYTGAVPVRLQSSQTLRDTYVEWHVFWSDVFSSSKTNTIWTNTTVDFSHVSIHEFSAPLIARHSGLAMDVYYSRTDLETPVIQWTPTGNPNQSFEFVKTPEGDGHYFLKPRHSGLCLDVHYSSPDPGTNVVQWTCTGAPNQRFQLVDAGGSYFYVKAKHSGQCLSIANGSTAPLADVVQMPCTGADSQRFRMIP